LPSSLRGAPLAILDTMIRRIVVVSCAVAALDVELTHADTRGTLRIGVLPLELVSSTETPVFGDGVGRVVNKYNAAASARDQMTGGTTARLDATDLGVAETLVVFTPGVELGSGTYFFRLEAPIGVAADLKSVGVGVYPINLQASLRRNLVVYASGGGSASWLDRDGSGDIGGLVAARAAVGARIGGHLVLEVGYNAFVLGGSINNERLAEMSDAGAMQLVQPEEVISAGEARGIVDASVGFVF
jgi:hypothetical protein